MAGMQSCALTRSLGVLGLARRAGDCAKCPLKEQIMVQFIPFAIVVFGIVSVLVIDCFYHKGE